MALWGLPTLWRRGAFIQSWERASYGVLLAGLALVACGSAYYHAAPTDATLVWDRLPMTVVFMGLLATTVGERISMRAGSWLLPVLLAIGIASVEYWQATGDLRPYVLVQFYPMLALPLMWLLFPPRYSGTGGLWAMAGFYALAKLLELGDRTLAAMIATGGHPWKHLAGAAGVLCYVLAMRRRVILWGHEPAHEPVVAQRSL